MLKKSERYEKSSVAEFLQSEKGEFLFCLIDTTNLPNTTGYHTQTVLAFFAWLRETNRVSSDKLSCLRILLVKEYLVHNY